MSSQKILGVVAAVAVLTAVQDSADAQFYSGEYSTFYQPYSTYYQPYTSYYSGPTTAYYGGGSGYTSYYGGSYGYGGNPFAPLVPAPSGYGWFGSGYTAAYGPSGYGYGGGCCSPCATGCSPCGGGCGIGGCATGNCATGNCSIPASQQMKPSPDNGLPMDESTDDTPRTYDENPMDDRGFRDDSGIEGSGTDNTGTDSFPGGIDSESFKIPMGLEELDLPGGASDPDKPLDADKPKEDEDEISVPGVNLNPPTTRPITPRNSAQAQPATHLDQRITWRSRPVIVPERQQVTASRPLIVRKTVKVPLNPAPTLVSHSNTGR